MVLPVHNGERVIASAVESVLEQTFDEFELLVVDDGSTDATPECLASLSDPRLRVLRNPVNEGIVASLNRGVAATTAPLIARLDADDACVPQRLARQVAEFERRPRLGLLASATTKIDVSGSVSRGQPPTEHAAIHLQLHFGNCLSHPTVMFRREVFAAANGYRQEWFPAEDYDLWLRMARLAEVGAIAEPLVTKVNAPTGISAMRGSEQRARVVDRSCEAVAAVTGHQVPRDVLERLVWPAAGDCNDLRRAAPIVLAVADAVRRDCRARGIPTTGLNVRVTTILRPSAHRTRRGRRCWAAMAALGLRHPRVMLAVLARRARGRRSR